MYKTSSTLLSTQTIFLPQHYCACKSLTTLYVLLHALSPALFYLMYSVTVMRNVNLVLDTCKVRRTASHLSNVICSVDRAMRWVATHLAKPCIPLITLPPSSSIAINTLIATAELCLALVFLCTVSNMIQCFGQSCICLTCIWRDKLQNLYFMLSCLLGVLKTIGQLHTVTHCFLYIRAKS